MYDILQLNEMLVPELKAVAEQLGNNGKNLVKGGRGTPQDKAIGLTAGLFVSKSRSTVPSR